MTFFVRIGSLDHVFFGENMENRARFDNAVVDNRDFF